MKGRAEARPAHAEPGRTTEQRRAANAMDTVPRSEDEALRKRYRAYADRLGPAILMNGLGQALATERAAAGTKQGKPEGRAHDLLYNNVQAWLCRPGGVYEPGDLLSAIIKGSQELYLRAQVEALAWLVWHKKFCRAYLPAPEPREEED